MTYSTRIIDDRILTNEDSLENARMDWLASFRRQESRMLPCRIMSPSHQVSRSAWLVGVDASPCHVERRRMCSLYVIEPRLSLSRGLHLFLSLLEVG